MTEQEAKTKWCPFARVGSEQSGLGSLNREAKYNDAVAHARCIGSACMAWRWTERRTPAGQNPAGGSFNAYGEDRGYCGLAGKP